MNYSATGPTIMCVGMPGGRTHYVRWAEYQAAKVRRPSPLSELDPPRTWGRRKRGGSDVCNHCNSEASKLRATIVDG